MASTTWGRLTIHKIGEHDEKIAILCKRIGKDAAVWKSPTKDVGENDNDALGFPGRWFCDVDIKTMQLVHLSSGCAGMQRAAGATLTRKGHFLVEVMATG